MNEDKTSSFNTQVYVENNRLYSKFGEIFFTKECRCLFVCTACDNDFEFFDLFIDHIGIDHQFQDVFQRSTNKRLVCISNVGEGGYKDEESELIEEDKTALFEYKTEEKNLEEALDSESVTERESESVAEREYTNFTEVFIEKSFDSECVSTSAVNTSSEVQHTEDDALCNEEENKSKVEHKCDMCAKKFASENNLVRHKWRHSSETKWACPTCGKVTTTKDGMILHIRRHHTCEKPFKCKLCEKSFASAAQRNLHNRVHTGYKPYVCEKCGKAFKLHTVLRYHMDWHLGIKNYKCEKCDKRFHSTSELNNHKSVHTWERPFACSDCALRFKTKRHLLRHKEVHSGNLKSCKYCNKQFAHISTLTSHLRLHQIDELE